MASVFLLVSDFIGAVDLSLVGGGPKLSNAGSAFDNFIAGRDEIVEYLSPFDNFASE